MICAGVCSGISAPAVAWSGLGWQWAFEAEIEPFPCAVLEHHRPDVPNYGDMTRYKEWPDAAIDIVIGGTPCQSFSVAGLRKGLDGPRGNLALTFIGMVDKYRPRWVVWENVPGVFSSGGGNDFQAFIDGMAVIGYFGAWRVLDAQWFGVAQRRRRCFAVFCAGDWRPAAAVLFEPESLRGDPAPSREARENVTGTLDARAGTGGYNPGPDGAASNQLIPEIAPTLQGASNGGGCNGPGRTADDAASLIPVASGGNRQSGSIGVATAVRAHGSFHGDFETETLLVFTKNQRDEVRQVQVVGALAAEPGMKQQTYLAFEPRVARNGRGAPSDVVPALKAQDGQTGKGDAAPCVFGFPANMSGTQHAATEGVSPSLAASNPAAVAGTAVRRLTATECERLQGFPDGYTAIPWRGKSADQCPDGPRYKALGNSMAVPVVRWIGERIQAYENANGRSK